MHSQTKDAIMGFLRDYYTKHGRHYYKDFYDLRRALPDMEPRIMQFTLNHLKRDGLVNFLPGHDKPLGITLTPSGMAYFEKEKRHQSTVPAQEDSRATGFERGMNALRGLLNGRK
ncbi:MAG: hypothetical protein AB1500_03550 [Bacillota bacterium]